MPGSTTRRAARQAFVVPGPYRPALAPRADLGSRGRLRARSVPQMAGPRGACAIARLPGGELVPGKVLPLVRVHLAVAAPSQSPIALPPLPALTRFPHAIFRSLLRENWSLCARGGGRFRCRRGQRTAPGSDRDRVEYTGSRSFG